MNEFKAQLISPRDVEVPGTLFSLSGKTVRPSSSTPRTVAPSGRSTRCRVEAPTRGKGVCAGHSPGRLPARHQAHPSMVRFVLLGPRQTTQLLCQQGAREGTCRQGAAEGAPLFCVLDALVLPRQRPLASASCWFRTRKRLPPLCQRRAVFLSHEDLA